MIGHMCVCVCVVLLRICRVSRRRSNTGWSIASSSRNRKCDLCGHPRRRSLLPRSGWTLSDSKCTCDVTVTYNRQVVNWGTMETRGENKSTLCERRLALER